MPSEDKWIIGIICLMISLLAGFVVCLILPSEKPCLRSHEEIQNQVITYQSGSIPVGNIFIPIFSSYTVKGVVTICDERSK